MKTFSAQKIHTVAKIQNKPKLNIVGPMSSLGLLVNVCGRKKNGMFYNKKITKVVVLMWCFGKILAGVLGQEEAVRSPEMAF